MKAKVYFRQYWFVGFKKWTYEIFADLGFVRLYVNWIKKVKDES